MFKDFALTDVSPVKFAVKPSNNGPTSTGPTTDASVDPLAGTTAPNGKPIWTPQQAADNLLRGGSDWTQGNYGAIEDGVITFGFWDSLAEVQASYYADTYGKKGLYVHADQQMIADGKFGAFTADQQAMAILNMQLWDDLIAVTFQQVDNAAEADITFGFVQMSPAAGAHAFYPQSQAINDSTGSTTLGQISGDVWGNYLYSGAVAGQPNIFADTSIGAYAWNAITHELGHSLGLAHGGDYNASDDNDGDGVPDPITYAGDAYFYQDSTQYTIMSYFDGSETGQAAVLWAGAASTFMFSQTPAVHDILAAQQVYGADMTTRAGDTVYGFNSTADRAVFNFTSNKAPIVTIWDGGGTDTLDLSGFDGNNIIDINEGAFSSAGYKIDAASKAVFGLATDAQVASFAANNGLGPDGRPVDNISIAYGAVIENATGGSGNDLLISNSVNNILNGNGGFDTVSYDRAASGVTVDLAADLATGGGGTDTLLSIEGAVGSKFNDTLTGDADANTLDGYLGDDQLNGGDGSDTASYQSATAGVTVNLGVAGAQNTGGAGIDTLVSLENLFGSAFADSLTGDDNANVLTGAGGNDALNGGGGADTADYAGAGGAVTVNLFAGTAAGGAGSDTLSSIENVVGGIFNDTIIASNGDNVINGGAGTDLVSFANATAGVTANLTTGAVTGGSGNDTLVAVESLIGSAHNDTLTGTSGANSLEGGLGNDTVAAGTGNDTVEGGLGDDVLAGEAGTDTLTYARAASAVTVLLAAGTATGGDGSDTISGFENVIGSAHGDILTGDANANTLVGGLGNDALDGGAGTDTANYAGATGAVNVNLFAGTATGAAGSDTLTLIENVVASAFNDTIVASDVNNSISGGAGADLVSYANAAAAVNVNLATGAVSGGSGNDSLSSVERVIGSGFNDTILGSSAANYLAGGAGNDSIKTGAGIDVVSLGAGNDTFVAEFSAANAALKSGTMSVDIITDFARGQDKIDLSALGDFTFGETAQNKTPDTVTYKTYNSVNGAEAALGFDIDGQFGAAGVSGPVTVVYVNDNGGPPEAAIILLNTSSVGAGDFILT